MSSLEEKQEQFSAYYLMAHPIKTNVIPLEEDPSVLSMQEFEQNMPYAFRIAGEMAEIQSQTLKPLRNLGEKLSDLVDYLQFQAKKIDLMMSYILQQQDDEQYQATTVKFGGGGAIITLNENLNIGDFKAIKLFLESESAAIYCIGEVITVEPSSSAPDSFDTSFVYTHIREQDQELLVRASLHMQTAALKKQHELNQK